MIKFFRAIFFSEEKPKEETIEEYFARHYDPRAEKCIYVPYKFHIYTIKCKFCGKWYQTNALCWLDGCCRGPSVGHVLSTIPRWS